MSLAIPSGANLLIKLALYACANNLNVKGDYDIAATYAVNDVIVWQGIAYKNILASTGNVPPNATYWTALTGILAGGTNGIKSLIVTLTDLSGATPFSWIYQQTGDPIPQPHAPQTSGTLVVDKLYKIVTFVATDDFTNVGAASNATGVEFTATGTTPTVWSNGSTLQEVILTTGKKYLISTFGASDVFTNIGAASNAAGVIFVATGDVPTTWTHSSILQEVTFPDSLNLAAGLLKLELAPAGVGVYDLRVSIARGDPAYIGSATETDLIVFDSVLVVNAPSESVDDFAATAAHKALSLVALLRDVL